MYQTVRYLKGIEYNRKFIQIDNLTELPPPSSDLAVGSIAENVDTYQYYILAGDNTWKLLVRKEQLEWLLP